MAYSNIDNPELHFQTLLHTEDDLSFTFDGSENMRPDLVWNKNRDAGGYEPHFANSVRGSTKLLRSTSTIAEFTSADSFTSFDADGFTIGNDNNGYVSSGTDKQVSWCWSAGGSTPSQTYTVKVVSDSGNKYRFDDFGTSAVTLDLQEGGTYTFDQSDSSNSGHPLRFSTTSDGSHGGGSEYTTGVTTVGTAGNSGAKTIITVGSGVATLYYYCTQHSGMGGQANTNSLFGSSNFSGTIQSNVSANITAGFSIISWQGNATSSQSVGHGLNAVPKVIFTKNTSDGGQPWKCYFEEVGNSSYLQLNGNDVPATSGVWSSTTPTSSIISISNDTGINGSGNTIIGFAFSEIKNYSKFFQYEGNSDSDGSYIHLGFSPAFIMVKPIDSADNWNIFDNKRSNANGNSTTAPYFIYANKNFAETTDTKQLDFLSTGFKIRSSGNTINRSSTFVGMAFASTPFVNSSGVPNNAI